MTGADALREAARRLVAAGIEGAGGDARALLAEAMGVARDRLTLHLNEELDAGTQARLASMLARRAAREPVARILGRRLFWGREFTVTPDVLDPRPETECLIAAALRGAEPARLIDLGTGTGCIAVTLLAEWPGARGVASDLSPDALGVARSNAERHGVAGRLDLVESDWFAATRGRFDLILSNPPYIAEAEIAGLAPEVLGHDPRMALGDGGDGLSAYRALARGAVTHLVPGGRVLVEIGWRQGAAVAEIFAAAGLAGISVLPDLDGRDRVVCALLPDRIV
ncbi:peptide chain release factor N(5)-glutamine methyltransferase [Roseovarius autotrophicus]|uniref:peptide chain release factor N(5)-glutamine methyltransferase n=1 Tax=Roseovarius autotrophicus TaxID=2824121 RepID=UPI0019DE8987|nr:peptide chain release factor N(5)-glutamine methyltransferase [Roseovarius autotrophicus]MBE0452465.1 peptide chain release factor N(5)-glutamine methyltransferase [Roseovarius sp.]